MTKALLSFIGKVANSRTMELAGGYMKIFAVLILICLTYGLVRFMRGLIKELAMFAVEAWRDVEIGQ